MKALGTYLFLALFFMVACSKNNGSDPAPTKASISGSVILYDAGTNLLDKSGMKVSVEGTSPLISTTTENAGKFTLADVPFGTYTLVYEKAGYGTSKKSGIEHKNTGSSTVITTIPSFGQTSATTVTALTAEVVGTDVLVNATTDPAGNSSNRRYLRFFYSSAGNVSNTSYNNYSAIYIAQINPYTHTLSKSDLNSMGFVPGTTAYIRAYGESFWSNDYLDITNGKTVFPNLNSTTTNPVSFVVP